MRGSAAEYFSSPSSDIVSNYYVRDYSECLIILVVFSRTTKYLSNLTLILSSF
jgi:hypothetical protein